jgi:hypothetical protein
MSEDMRAAIRLVATVFPGVQVWWNGAWRPVKLKGTGK